MAELTWQAASEQLLAVLQEGCEGPQNPWSCFTDHVAESALFGTLAKLSAAEASRPIGGSSDAAQAYHVLFGLRASVAWIRGDRSPNDWKQSWAVSTVDDAAWSQLPGANCKFNSASATWN